MLFVQAQSKLTDPADKRYFNPDIIRADEVKSFLILCSHYQSLIFGWDRTPR
jgi:hypothetical protein